METALSYGLVKDYEYLQIDIFAKMGEGRYTFRNCNRNTYTEYTLEKKHF